MMVLAQIFSSHEFLWNAETLALASLSCADNIQSYWRTISLLIYHRGKHLTLLELNFPPMSSCTDTYMLDVAVPAILMSFISMPIRTALTILETLTSIQMFPMYRMYCGLNCSFLTHVTNMDTSYANFH